MGSHNGTYVPWHEPVWSHAKTKAAAAMLVADKRARVPEEFAPALVGRALHALSCWAIRDGETGSTGRLSDAEFAQIAWPEGVARGRLKPSALGSLLRNALKSAHFLEEVDGDERIHDFGDHNSRVLNDRQRRRDERAKQTTNTRVNQPRSTRATADSPRTVHGQSVDSPTTSSGQVGDASTTCPRLARASGSEAERLGGLEACTAAHARTPSDEHGYATTTTSPQVEPPTGRSLRLPDKHAPDPDDPQEAQGRAAHRLELTLTCAYSEASKAIQSLVIAGASLEWINARITASRGSTSTPWDWAMHAKRAWADAFGEGAHIA